MAELAAGVVDMSARFRWPKERSAWRSPSGERPARLAAFDQPATARPSERYGAASVRRRQQRLALSRHTQPTLLKESLDAH